VQHAQEAFGTDAPGFLETFERGQGDASTRREVYLWLVAFEAQVAATGGNGFYEIRAHI